MALNWAADGRSKAGERPLPGVQKRKHEAYFLTENGLILCLYLFNLLSKSKGLRKISHRLPPA